MIDARKLNEAIYEMDQHSKKLKTIVEVYEELSKLQQSISENADKIASLINLSANLSEKIKKDHDNIMATAEKLFIDINTLAETIEKELKSDIQNYQDNALISLEKSKQDIIEKHNELERKLLSLSEMNKAHMLFEIRNESTQIQRSLEKVTLDSNTKLQDYIKITVKELSEELHQKFKKQKRFLTWTIILALLNLIPLVILLIK